MSNSAEFEQWFKHDIGRINSQTLLPCGNACGRRSKGKGKGTSPRASKKIIKLPKYISTHIMLLHSIKQYLIIVSTSFFQLYSLTLLFLLKLLIFTK